MIKGQMFSKLQPTMGLWMAPMVLETMAIHLIILP